MPAPSASWSVKRVHATYRNRLSLAKEPGTWTAVASGRIVNTLIDGTKQIFRAGEIGNGALNTTEGEPSLVLDLPVTDDPDNLPQGGEITLTITFSTGGTEVYHLSPLMAWPADPGTDLATLADPALVPSAPAYAIIGVPGGVAELDADGDVIDADGVKVTGGGTDVELVRDTIAAALVAGTNVTITPNDGADTITIASTGGGSTDAEVVRDTIASALVAGSGITVTPDDTANTITIGATASTPGGIYNIDDFAGASDDAKFGAALTFAAAQTYRPILQFPARRFGPLTTSRTPYAGMRLIGPLGNQGVKNQEISSAGQGQSGQDGRLVNHRVRVQCGSGTSSLFVQTADLSDVNLAEISFSGSATSQFWHQTAGILYPTQWDSLSFDGFLNVLGNTTTPFTMTQGVFSGHWTVLNFSGTPIHIGGSDNSLWIGGYINANSPASVAGAGKPIIHFDWLEKTEVGYMYITAENGWSGLRVESQTSRTLTIHGGTFEGRATDNPATWPVLDFRNGGRTVMYSPRINYVLPTNANGAIVQSAGTLTIHEPVYQKASSALVTFPLLYQTGGLARVIAPTNGDGASPIRIRWKDAALGAQLQDIAFPTGNSVTAW